MCPIVSMIALLVLLLEILIEFVLIIAGLIYMEIPLIESVTLILMIAHKDTMLTVIAICVWNLKIARLIQMEIISLLKTQQKPVLKNVTLQIMVIAFYGYA